MPSYQRTAIHSIDDLKAVANHAGSFFFSPGALKFFNSHILSDVWAVDGADTHEGARFIFLTSEQYPYQPRHYAVRMMTLQSIRDDRPYTDIENVSDDHYETKQAAFMAAQLKWAELRYADKKENN